MTLSPRLRKFVLTVHVASSVGWLGAVACSLVLAVLGLAGEDVRMVRAAYLAMDSIGGGVLVPLALASLLTGLVQGLGTEWGLFRHYWVLIKLLINVFATVVLVLYTQTLGRLEGLAANPSVTLGELRDPSPVLHAAGALMLLVVATALSVFKPRGVTSYGWRKQRERRRKRRLGGPGRGNTK
ncbi:MAG: DUF2269 domain-containing protein [Rubrobacteraceae bacterium]|nr:DUF2269 domain-containing protein [Rubrobacteraceae bacterium]